MSPGAYIQRLSKKKKILKLLANARRHDSQKSKELKMEILPYLLT